MSYQTDILKEGGGVGAHLYEIPLVEDEYTV